MKCPNCNSELIAGEAYFKKTGADFMVLGLGSEDLRMKPDQGDDFLLLSGSEKAAAQFCRECGVALIATEKGKRPAVRNVRS